MARGVNKVILIGTLGQDPEVKYMPNGNAVANVSLATNESWKDKNTGQLQEKTEWHRVVVFGKLAEVAGEYLRKGSQCYFEGKLQTRKWQDQASGQDKYTTEVVVDMGGAMQMLGGGQGQQQGQQVGGFSQPQGQMNQAQAGQAQQGNPQGGYQQQQPQQQAQQRQAQAQPNQPYNQGQQQGQQQAQQGQYQGANQQQSGYQQQQMQQRNAQARQQAQQGQQGQMNQSQQGQQQGQQPQGGMNFDDDIPFAPIGLQHKALLSCI